MSARIIHCRTLTCMIASLLLACSSSLAQQPRNQQQQPQGKWFEGELKTMSRGGIGVEADGKQAIIPVSGATNVKVTANGDPGFLKPGVTVTVRGERRTTTPAIMNATLIAHMSPRETAAPQLREVDAAGELVTFNAVIVQTEPEFIVRATDTIQLRRQVGNNWVKAPPTRNLTVPVKLHDRMADNVEIEIGSNVSMAKPGDSVRFYMVQGIPIARDFEITLSEKLDSEKFAQPEPKKKGKTKKDDDDKPDPDAKPDPDGKPDPAGTPDAKPETEKPATETPAEGGAKPDGESSEKAPEAATEASADPE